jgi:hypothetical protein
MQSLPAKRQYDLESRADFVQITKELDDLHAEKEKTVTSESLQALEFRQRDLYRQKRQLVDTELRSWQEDQSWLPGTTQDVDGKSMYFDRVRKLDPPRDRLATHLFLDVPLRSEIGGIVIQDMIQLCKGAPEVAYRPSCMPKEGRCPVNDCAKEMERWVRCHP